MIRGEGATGSDKVFLINEWAQFFEYQFCPFLFPLHCTQPSLMKCSVKMDTVTELFIKK